MIDMLSCELSKWRGKSGHCRWCDSQLTGRQKAWCGKDCFNAFTSNHKYSAARRRTMIAARGACGCPDEAFYVTKIGPDGIAPRPKKSPKHAVCRQCGKCSAAVGVLECNHIVPRLGDRNSYSCLHHLKNLEALCKPCHQKVTMSQRILWGAKAGAKAVKKTAQRVKPKPVKRAARRRAA